MQQLQIKAEFIRVLELVSKLINKYRSKEPPEPVVFMKEPMLLGLVTSSFFPLKCLRKQWFYTRISYLIV
jgi:hypothetical protein